ncbi:hypothetical protein CI710_11875 [Aeromonas salmonicida]|nr:hypothetical protein CI710_11875 [Aeromonas salmonicida]PNO59884.1 hypothetical protein MC65_016805 [Aeromonas caviae]
MLSQYIVLKLLEVPDLMHLCRQRHLAEDWIPLYGHRYCNLQAEYQEVLVLQVGKRPPLNQAKRNIAHRPLLLPTKGGESRLRMDLYT